MDAALQLLLCDIESDLYSAKELLEKAPCISDEINIDEIIERATFLTSLIKKNNDDIEKCIDLLSRDGIDSKSSVKSILSTCNARFKKYMISD